MTRPTTGQDAVSLPPSLSGDVAGGITAAMLALPQALALGTLVWLPLGAAGAHWGVVAGLVTAIIGGAVGRLTGTPWQISGPRASTAVILAGLVAWLVKQPDLAARPELVLLCVAASVLLGGLLQLGMAALGFGRTLKFIPYPVLAGFMFGIALVILIQQLPPLLGMPPDTAVADMWARMKPLALLVGLVTVFVAIIVTAHAPRVPAPLAALVAGALTHWTLAGFVGVDALGATLVADADAQGFAWPLTALAGTDFALLSRAALGQIGITALLLAVVGSIDSLLCAATIDAATGSDQDGNRVLRAQGAGNLFAAGAGGLFVSSTNLIAITNHRVGGRTLRAGIVHSLILAGLLFGAGFLAGYLPYSVLAGIMVTLALAVADDWWRDFSATTRGPDGTVHDGKGNLLVAALVAATTALVNVVSAVLVGVIAATVLLIARMSSSVIHRVSDASARSSLRVRKPDALAFLREHGRAIAVVELQGYLFFGSTDRLKSEVEALAEGRECIILDFRRVVEIEASGARQLALLGKALAQRRVDLALAHVPTVSASGAQLRQAGVSEAIPERIWFADLDRALEWAENALLDGHIDRTETSRELALERTVLLDGLDPREAVTLRGFLTRENHAAGTAVFREGEPGDRLYILTQGEVSIDLQVAGKNDHAPTQSRVQRLAAFGPGMVFGEMALIEGKPRSADAVVKLDAVTHALTAEAFATLQRDHPDIAIKLIGNITRLLAARLRATSEQLRQTY
jgi:sulfate permease, SulP family